MAWGVDLWDRTQEVALHVDKGIEGCEKLRIFIKERCQIEIEYATRLKKLVKSNIVVSKKGKSMDDDLPYTWQKGFQGYLNELHDLAMQHDRLAEMLGDTVLKPLEETVRSSKEGRKRVMNDVATAEVKYKQSKKQLEGTQERYKKAFGAAVQGEQNYERAEKDVNLSRANVDKFKSEMLRRRQECDDAKKDYAAQLEHTNEDQRVHFDETLPKLMNQLEDCESNRITAFRDCLQRANDAEKDVLKIMMKCTDVVDTKLAIIDARRDNQYALDTLKTGYRPPDPFPFEELSLNNPGGNVQPKNQNKESILKRTRSTSKAPLEAQRSFGHLPPNQQKNELTKKLNQLQEELAKKTKELDGVQKLEQTYRQNPKLGNPDTLRDQMGVINKVIEGLNAEIREFEGYLHEATARLTGASNRSTIPVPNIEQPVNARQSTAADPNPGTVSVVADPEPAVDDFVVGKAVALYAYEANDASALTIQANESLHVIEADSQNSGWTRVRRTTTADEGYVPTAYLKSICSN